MLLSRFLVSMCWLMYHLYLPQAGQRDCPFPDLPPILVLPGLDLDTVDPLGLRVLVVVLVNLTDCLAIFTLLKTKEHTRIITDLKQVEPIVF